MCRRREAEVAHEGRHGAKKMTVLSSRKGQEDQRKARPPSGPFILLPLESRSRDHIIEATKAEAGEAEATAATIDLSHNMSIVMLTAMNKTRSAEEVLQANQKTSEGTHSGESLQGGPSGENTPRAQSELFVHLCCLPQRLRAKAPVSVDA